jgi:hypothetical protein
MSGRSNTLYGTVLLKPKKEPLSVNANNHVHVTSSLDAAINFTTAKEANETSL